jgi:hypothetical protein
MVELETRANTITERRSAVLGKIVAGAAAQDAAVAFGRPGGVSHVLGRIVIIRVLAPLRNIAVHIVQSPEVGLLPSHRMGRFSRIETMPAVIGQGIFIVAK